MVRQFVTFMLGEFGGRVLQFYIDHSLAINGIVVAYGAVLLVAHLNLRRIEKAALETVRRGLRSSRGADETSPSADAILEGLCWREIIAQASFFPLVARGNSLIPRPSNVSNVEKLIPVSRLRQQISVELADGEGAGRVQAG